MIRQATTRQTSTSSESDSVVVIRETVRDTVVTVAADSSLIRALVECDSLGQAHLRELLDYMAGERLGPPEIDIDNNVLTAKAHVDSMAIYMRLKDRYESRRDVRTETVRETVEVEVNRLTWWQALWVKLGQTLSGALAAWIILKLFKTKILSIWKLITKM